jgi:methyl-accepting chemotaxis protein
MLILVSIGFFVGVRNHNFAVDRAKEYTQLMADNNSQKVGGFFKEFKGIVVANTENLASQLNNQKLTTEQITSLLQLQLKKHPQFESVWFILDAESIEGNEQFNSWAKYELNKKNQGEVLFKTNSKGAGFFDHKLSDSEGVSLTEPYKSEGLYLADLTAPIHVDGTLKGFIGITLNLAFLTDYVQKAEIFEGGFITVMTNTSQFVAHANPELIGKPFGQNFPQDESDWNVENNVSKAKSFDITTNFQRATYYSYFVPMQIDDSPKRWMIEVTVPMHKILESSKTAIRNSVIFALFGVLIMIIVIFQVTRRIIGPIRKVTNILDLLAEKLQLS